MRKSIIILAAITAISCSIITSCTSTNETEKSTDTNVKKAKENADEANREYQIELENYRKETSQKIAENEKTIAEFKTKITPVQNVLK